MAGELVVPATQHAYKYALNNPLAYSDPEGMQGSSPAPGISRERHARLEALREIADDLSSRLQQGEITQVEALASLLRDAAPMYQRRFLGFVISENPAALISDLGVVIGGLEVKGIWEAAGCMRARGLEPSCCFELIGSGHALEQYYVGYPAFVGESGLADDFAQGSDNQVRHFLGGLSGGNAFVLPLTRHYMLQGEDAIQDQNLYGKAFELADRLMGRGSPRMPLHQASDWVLRNLADEEIKRKHGIG